MNNKELSWRDKPIWVDLVDKHCALLDGLESSQKNHPDAYNKYIDWHFKRLVEFPNAKGNPIRWIDASELYE